VGSISATARGSASGDEIGRVTRGSLHLWDPASRRFGAHALTDDAARARGSDARWARAAASVALVSDVGTLRAMEAGTVLTLGELARDREGAGRVLEHPWRDVRIAMAGPRARFPATAFLIAPDLLVTSYHCVRAELNHRRPLGDLRFLFDFRWTGMRGSLGGPLYEVHPGPPHPLLAAGTTGWDDHVVLRVRPVPGSRRASTGIPVAKSLDDGERVTAICHPFGLPMCTAGVEATQPANDARVACAHLDVFSGCSGAPVLRTSDRRVVGIVQSKAGWDFVATEHGTIRLASCDAALGEPARFVRMSVVAAGV
jgi:hypothetical protein